MAVRVTLKSAAQTVPDFSLDCEMTWTIAQVKDQISTLYPTRPKREHQKLIYGGKLLPDHLTLQAVLNKMQDVHILHIVCPFTYVPTTQKATTKVPATPLCTASPPPNPSGIYPQVNTQIPGFMGGIPGVAPDMAQQYLAMQQMYAQLMTQYFAQYNGVYPSAPVPTVTPPPQQAPPIAPPPNRRLIDEEEGRPQDYMDYLYMFSRAALLVAMLLSYSSFSRVMSVFAMVLLLTLFAKINRRNRAQEPERPNAEPQPVDRPAEEVPPTENNPVPEDSIPEPPPPTSVPATIFGLVSAFFSSLIPTDPIPLN